MFPRQAAPLLNRALADTPVVLLHGARQSGKTTLVRSLDSRNHPLRYLTLDDATALAAARDDPAGFIAALDGPAVIDEVQLAPQLFPAIKLDVDRKRRPGRFLLTGSSNVLLLPRLSESLAGRMEIVTLWPLARCEIAGRDNAFVDALFAPRPAWADAPPRPPGRLLDAVLTGGFPEAVRRAAGERRSAWFASYVTTILQRDMRELASIEGLTALPRLLALLAARSGSLVNYADLSRDLALPQTTLKRYIALLETTFLVRFLPPWSGNLGLRLVKSPKSYLCDTGLLAHLIGADRRRVSADRALFGRLFENFVLMELTKLVAWSRTRPALYFFRSHAGVEVDVVLESPAGEIVGVEIKTADAVAADDFRGLRALADAVGSRFRRGVVLYAGRERIAFDPVFSAVPVDALWSA